MSIRYPVYRPQFVGKERENVLACLDSTWISSKGEFIARFETTFADYLGMKHALSVSNGTVALHVALEALGIGPGDEVIVPTLTYIASVNAITYTGASVVFVDSEADYWQMDVRDVAAKITPRTRAIMAVHLYGQACDTAALRDLARDHSVVLVEDCAEALGTQDGGRLVGGFGQVSTFSFFGNKTITTGEGGMVVTDDDALAARIAKLKGQGLAANREYWHDAVGYNYRMTNICAAIGCAQMEGVHQALALKRQLAERYRERLSGLPLKVHAERPGSVHSYWMVSLMLDEARHREPLRDHLRAAGIETRPLFYPVHQMEMYRAGAASAYPVADDLAGRGLNIPSYPALTSDDVDEIVGAVRGYFQSSADRRP